MLVPTLINMACVNVESKYQGACSKAMEAGTKQTQVYQYDDKAENYFRMIAMKDAKDILGEDTIRVIGGTVYIYNTVNSKSVTFDLPNFGICNKASNNITLNSYRLDLMWDLHWLK